jgi:hypothetical protein
MESLGSNCQVGRYGRSSDPGSRLGKRRTNSRVYDPGFLVLIGVIGLGVGGVEQAEGWERTGARWRSWLTAHPATPRIARIAALVAVVAAVVVPGFRAGMGAWLPCWLMLLAWLAISPTKTLRWTSVMRLFAVSTVWAVVVAWFVPLGG